MFLKKEPSKQDIIEAHERIKNYIHRTPILTSSSINSLFGCNLFFKCENFQKVGAFKIRGASNSVFSLSEDEIQNGVATHSSGNHAAALALSAKIRNIPAYIVMPKTATRTKISAVESYGGKIIYCEPNLKSREETLKNIINETNAVFVHSYDNYSVIAGQATCAKEIYEELNNKVKLDFIIAPVGGGGLLSGTCLSTIYFSPNTKVIGAEPSGADDAFRSLRDNFIHPSINPSTICDGLLTQLSDKTFSIIKKNVYKILRARDDSIIYCMKLIWERMKIIVEPSSAITLAVIFENKEEFVNKNIALILTGGNVDLEKLPWKN
ncbi:pyridoxal-phosphate dependent enzyme [Rosettibacter firmus]|uniref:pyridoxal-phosphate dependent enzyme n=1 Tax=Rosettibacter firmus TaxID=3111522 RepID=UPI00336C1B4F